MTTVDGMKAMQADLVFAEIRVEGVAATFAETEEILRNGEAAGVDGDDVNVIIGMKHAWEYLFESYERPLTTDAACEYNRRIGYGGTFRSPGELRRDGVVYVMDWVPQPSSESTVAQVLETARDSFSSHDEIACAIALETARRQPFFNGNKRTAQMLANHYLAHEDAGLAFILSDTQARSYFLESLYDYYTGLFPLDEFVGVLKHVAIKECGS